MRLALPLRLALRAHGLGFALTACLQLGLCPRSLGYTLAAWALPLRLALRACGLGFALADWALPLQLALRARGLGFAPSRLGLARGLLAAWALPLRLALLACGLGFALAAHATRSRLGLCTFMAHATCSGLDFVVMRRCREGVRKMENDSAGAPRQ